MNQRKCDIAGCNHFSAKTVLWCKPCFNTQQKRNGKINSAFKQFYTKSLDLLIPESCFVGFKKQDKK